MFGIYLVNSPADVEYRPFPFRVFRVFRGPLSLRSAGKLAFDESQRFFARRQGAFELPRLHGLEDFAESRAGLQAEGDEIAAGDERRRDERLAWQILRGAR